MSFLRLPIARGLSRPSVARASCHTRLFFVAPFHPLRMASSVPAPRFAEGEDPQQLGPDTETLQQQGWALDADGMGVTKTFHFKSYFKAVVRLSGQFDVLLWSIAYIYLVLCQLDCVRKFNKETSPHYDYSKHRPE